MTKQTTLLDEPAVETTALQTVPERSGSPLAILDALMERGASVDELAKLYELQAAYEAREAKKEFSRAMIVCQSEMPQIERNKLNKQTNSMYADITAAHGAMKPVYMRHGFSVVHSQGESNLPNHYRWLAVVTHTSGHSETHQLDLPTDDEGMKGGKCKTAVQGVASSGTYGQRILECRIFNVTIPWLDKDGNSVKQAQTITLEQVATINDWLIQKDVKLDDFLKWAEVKTLDELPMSKYSTAIQMLKDRKAGAKR